MMQIRLRPLALVLALTAGFAAPGALAQTEIVPAINPQADRLAQQMRVLAADPRDMRALLEAGLLSARLGDSSAAFAFFQRAEALDPTNPRILAGRATVLVRMERPGEALRLFQTAEGRGLSMRDYAADRGFAYDLLGQPRLAQADYRVALQADRDDETVRRYALSLGITGKTDEAMRELDPLLRRRDRAAWRARAFILAMNGDVPGAERIAQSMMPGSAGSALTPFFRRLSALPVSDRAFAVHFGSLSPTPARLADARMAPAMAAYVPDAPVQVAQARPAPAAPAQTRDRRSRRERERDERQARAQAARTPAASPVPAAPVQTASAAPLPTPPAFTRPAPAPVVTPVAPPREEEIDTPVRAADPPARSPAPVQLASASPIVPERDTRVRLAAANPPAAATPVPVTLPVAAQPQPRAEQPAAPAPQPRVETPAPAPVQPAPQPEAAAPGPAAPGQEDSVLASIVANITIPAEELAVVAAPAEEPRPAPVRTAAAEPKPAPAKPKAEPKKADAAKPEAKKADAAKSAKKPDAKKPEPKKPDPAKTDPARIWVQVAGGANEDALPKAWKAAVAKAPAAFKGKSGWWTPLRATNRVLAGPFKTATEAQAFVNTVGKAGVSGFVFTSEAGQKVTKLPAQ